MNGIKVLDCTLRDGGCVNDFNFGSVNMHIIKRGLEDANVDIIECGYIDENKGSEHGRTQFINEKAISDELLVEKKKNIMYVAMIDYGKFDCDKLGIRSDNSIDGIRVAFHKKNVPDMVRMCKTILEKGYNLFIQPMAILRYSDEEILKLINLINNELNEATAVYIVDSFGEMRLNEFRRIVYLIEHNLNKNIAIGFHSHNNLQLSYANAIQMIEFNTERSKIIDASIMGMGKGAGNLNTELLLEHLNYSEKTNYNIAPLLDVIDLVLNQLYAKDKWGYSIEYYLSSKNHCTPSYAKYFYEKHLMSVEQISILLGMIAEEKKLSFDKEYAHKIYLDYNNAPFNDEYNFEFLKNSIGSKNVLLIGPGKSIVENEMTINRMIDSSDDTISIMLNMTDEFDTEYVFTNKIEIFNKALKKSCKIIALSNMGKGREEDLIFDYKKWNNTALLEEENSFNTIMNILEKIGVRKVYLAGFDGFDLDIDKNYYDDMLKRNLPAKKIYEMNLQIIKTLKRYGDKICFEFLTPSKYEYERK